MNKAYKPQGYSSVSVYVMANRAQRVIDFLTETLDAKPLRRFDLPDGTLMHAEIQIDDTVIMIADSSDASPPFPVWLHVYVTDVDASYKRMITAGGVSVEEPNQKEGDPDRRAGVNDPCGNTWWVATQME